MHLLMICLSLLFFQITIHRKSWLAGWYDDRHATFEKSQGGANYKLIGQADYTPYQENPDDKKVIIKINQVNSSTDYYVMFNRKTGNNSGTQEGGNQVLVTSAGAEGNGYAASILLAKLSAGGSHTVNVDGTNVEIVVNSINLSVTPAVADVTIGDGTSAPSKSPTSRPTLPPGSTVLLACGSTAGSCRQSATNDPTRVANLNESHEVRCCVESSTNPGGWSKHSSGKCAADGFTSTWGESDFSGGVGCVHSATYDEAQQICSNAGGRLCTAAELLADCTRGSGCSHDNDYIWSSTPGTISTESPTTRVSTHLLSILSYLHINSYSYISINISNNDQPTRSPSRSPVTSKPTALPSRSPSRSPVTAAPSVSPSSSPTKAPTPPTNPPTNNPTHNTRKVTTNYEAETYTSFSGVSIKTAHPGYTGVGFVDYGGAGTWIEMRNVDGGMGGVCSITTNYALGSGTRYCSVTVNGALVQGQRFTYRATGSWALWEDSNTIQIPCNPGATNRIRITAGPNTAGPNMNSITVTTDEEVPTTNSPTSSPSRSPSKEPSRAPSKEVRFCCIDCTVCKSSHTLTLFDSSLFESFITQPSQSPSKSPSSSPSKTPTRSPSKKVSLAIRGVSLFVYLYQQKRIPPCFLVF